MDWILVLHGVCLAKRQRTLSTSNLCEATQHSTIDMPGVVVLEFQGFINRLKPFADLSC